MSQPLPLHVPEMAAVEDPAEVEVLYWVGCAAAADPRIGAVARAVVRILNHAGVRFAVLGAEEQCTGDPARRTGNELHFDMLARANIETLERYGVRRVLTHCPHCFHTLGTEYPALGGRYEVVHHSQFIRELLASGRLRLEGRLEGRLTVHDACYLGRHNGEYEAPRVVAGALGLTQIEMRRSRERSFCCGAGGGHGFFEDEPGGDLRVNQHRAREAVETGAGTVCTACPFCLGMLEDGVGAVGAADKVRVRDLAELVAALLPG